MKSSFAILIFGIAQIGCSSSYIISSSPQDDRLSFSEFNAAAEFEKAQIVFQDDSTLYVQGVLAEPDSTSWLHPTTGARVTVPTYKIKKIVLTNRTLGALEGAGIGLLSGGGAGLLTAAIWVGSPEDLEGLAYIILPAIGGGAGLLTGTIIGVVGGHTHEYEFLNELEKP
ncbi:MAG: hypothetical protein Q7S39_04740 [Ignavibacteria bacterium]|nr:hypothetical protein [Ignavibacteria bacterium]